MYFSQYTKKENKIWHYSFFINVFTVEAIAYANKGGTAFPIC